MRLLNIFAALSALAALLTLTYVGHALNDAAHGLAAERLKVGAFMQLGAAASALAIANRTGLLNLIAGALIIVGAALFVGVMWGLALEPLFGFTLLAPVGGISLMLGFVVLIFAKPGASPHSP